MHVSFVVNSICDEVGENAIIISRSFIKEGHVVHFIIFNSERKYVNKLPKEAIYTFINAPLSILNIFTFVFRLRKWIKIITYWNSSEVFFVFEEKIKTILNYFLKLQNYRKPLFLLKKDLVSKYLSLLSNFPLGIPIFPDNKKILIIAFGGVGDVVQRFAEAKILKIENPSLKVWVLADKKYEALIKTQSYFDGVIYGYKKPIRVLCQTIFSIRKEKFDFITDMSNVGLHWKFLLWFSGVENRLPRIRLKNREEIILEISNDRRQVAKSLLSFLPKHKLFVCIGAGAKVKMYPSKFWKILLKKLIEDGWGLVFCGHGQLEKQILREITSEFPLKSYMDLIDKTSLNEIASIANQCEYAIGNDTGLMHIALLSGIPTFGIFSQPVGFGAGYYTVPWFYELTVTKEISRFKWTEYEKNYILDQLPPEKIYKEFLRFTATHTKKSLRSP